MIFENIISFFLNFFQVIQKWIFIQNSAITWWIIITSIIKIKNFKAPWIWKLSHFVRIPLGTAWRRWPSGRRTPLYLIWPLSFAYCPTLTSFHPVSSTIFSAKVDLPVPGVPQIKIFDILKVIKTIKISECDFWIFMKDELLSLNDDVMMTSLQLALNPSDEVSRISWTGKCIWLSDWLANQKPFEWRIKSGCRTRDQYVSLDFRYMSLCHIFWCHFFSFELNELKIFLDSVSISTVFWKKL